MRVKKRITMAAAATAAAALLTAGLRSRPRRQPRPARSSGSSFDDQIASTVPANGDVNPYGVAVVRQSQGKLHSGDVLVSNFNDARTPGHRHDHRPGAPDGKVSQFAQIGAAHLPGTCPGGVGPHHRAGRAERRLGGRGPPAHRATARSSPAAGCLMVLNSQGKVVETFAGHGINGPWDMTAAQFGPFAELFVTNVLNGTVAAAGHVVHRGTVQRLLLGTFGDSPPRLLASTTIGSGFAERTDPAALVIGPTGVGLGRDGTLYVADTLANRIAAIPDAVPRPDSAGRGQTVTSGGALNAPLGVAIAPGGDVLSVNSGDGNIVETTPSGDQVATHQLDASGSPPGAGALFGLAVAPHQGGVYYVDDAVNTLNLLH